MPDDSSLEKSSAERRLFKAAFEPGNSCPPAAQLEQLLIEGSTPPAALAAHVESCAFCRTEVRLLREFEAGAPRETETAAVQLIATRLRERSNEIFQPNTAPVDVKEPWWRLFWRTPWFSPAALAAAAIVVVVAVGLQTRISQPVLHPPGAEPEVLRSNAIVVTAPAGDVGQAPSEIRWQPAPGAATYKVRLLEVDGQELWNTETAEGAVQLPGAVRARIVPAKTLLWQVSAFDKTGHQVAISDTVRFRVLQKPYQP
jgi:hypothetical protein